MESGSVPWSLFTARSKTSRPARLASPGGIGPYVELVVGEGEVA
jgi:hypothetical protein